jgi:hypothetical protein
MKGWQGQSLVLAQRGAQKSGGLVVLLLAERAHLITEYHWW